MTSHYQRSDCQFRSKVCCESTLLLLQQRAHLTSAEAGKCLNRGKWSQYQWRRYALATRAVKPYGCDAAVLSVVPLDDHDVFLRLLHASMNRIIQAVLKQDPGTRHVYPELTVKSNKGALLFRACDKLTKSRGKMAS